MPSLPQPEGGAAALRLHLPALTRDPRILRLGPATALAALLAVGGLVLAHLTRGTTFYADEWDWILNRRHGGLSSLLQPHQQHLSLVPLVVYRLLFATFGLRHYAPYLACVIAAQLACAALLFRYALRRVGPLFALLAAALILFFGPGSIDFLWAFQMAWVFVLVCAIGALLALDRHDGRGDVMASLLMALALASAGPGLAVALGLGLEMVWTRGRRGLWMAGVPLGLFALWWVVYQNAGVLLESVFHIASFTATSAAASLTSLTGLLSVDVTADTSSFHMWGPLLLVLCLAALVWRLRALGGVPVRVVALLCMAVGFWLITAIGRGAFQAGILVLSERGDESRYTYVGAALVLLLVLELARGSRSSWRVGSVVAVALVAAIASNIGVLRAQAQYLRGAGADTAAYLGTLDMTRPVVSPRFDSAGFLLGRVPARGYFTVERELGSPAWNATQLARADDGVRRAADQQLIAIHRVGLVPASAGLVGRRCRRVSAGLPLRLTLPATGVAVSAGGGGAAVALRRFSSQFDPLGTLRAGSRALVRVAPDDASQPWQLLLTPASGATVCALKTP